MLIFTSRFAEGRQYMIFILALAEYFSSPQQGAIALSRAINNITSSPRLYRVTPSATWHSFRSSLILLSILYFKRTKKDFALMRNISAWPSPDRFHFYVADKSGILLMASHNFYTGIFRHLMGNIVILIASDATSCSDRFCKKTWPTSCRISKR